jgi:hypothetical protein
MERRTQLFPMITIILGIHSLRLWLQLQLQLQLLILLLLLQLQLTCVRYHWATALGLTPLLAPPIPAALCMLASSLFSLFCLYLPNCLLDMSSCSFPTRECGVGTGTATCTRTVIGL